MRLILGLFLSLLVGELHASVWQPAAKISKQSMYQAGYERPSHRGIYVCRTHLWGSLQLGVAWRKKKRCYIPYAKKLYTVDNFSVLSQIEGSWQPYYGYFPSNAWILGAGVKKVPLALCRAYYRGSLLPGKTWRNHHLCDVVTHGKVRRLARFSIFIKKPKDAGGA